MDKAKKKQIKKVATWVLLAALVAGLTAMPLLAKAEAEADGPTATVHSGKVTTGTVSTTLRGGGTLTTEDLATNIGSRQLTQILAKWGQAIRHAVECGISADNVGKIFLYLDGVGVRKLFFCKAQKWDDARAAAEIDRACGCRGAHVCGKQIGVGTVAQAVRALNQAQLLVDRVNGFVCA